MNKKSRSNFIRYQNIKVDLICQKKVRVGVFIFREKTDSLEDV